MRHAIVGCLVLLLSPPSEAVVVFGRRFTFNITPATGDANEGPSDALSELVKSGISFIRRQLEEAMGNHAPAEVAGIHVNNADDGTALLAAVKFNAFISLCLLGLFMCLLKYIPAVYAHRSMKESEAFHPSLPVPFHSLSPVTWAVCSSCVPDDEASKLTGLDSLLLSDYHFLCRDILRFLAVFVISVLCPLNYYITSELSDDLLGRLSLGKLVPVGDHNILAGPWGISVVVWAYVSCVWFVVCVGMRSTFVAQKRFLSLRYKWLTNLPAPQATTLLVENIPRGFRSDGSLLVYFSGLFGSDAVERAYVVRNTTTLRQLIAQAETLDLQEGSRRSCFWHWLFGRSPSGSDDDSIVQQREEAMMEVQKEKARIASAVSREDPEVVTSSGFVTFATRRACRLALQEQLRHSADDFLKSVPPEPSDVNYESLAAGYHGVWLCRFFTLLVFGIWMPMIVVISGLATPKTLRMLPFFDGIFQRNPYLEAHLEGIAATVAMRACLLFLPNVIALLLRTFEAAVSGAQEQVDLQRRYYNFLVVFVVLVNAVGISVVSSLEVLVQSPASGFTMLADTLPRASHFYANYLIFGTTCLMSYLLRIPVLAKYLGYRMCGVEAQAARRLSEHEDQDSDGPGARMALASLMMTIALVFCTCMPIILLPAMAYFFLGGHVYRFLAIYCEARRSDRGGEIWVDGLRNIHFALLLYTSLMVGILYQQAGLVPACAAAASLLVVLYGASCFNSLVWTMLPFEAVADADKMANLSEPDEKEVWQVYAQAECTMDDDLLQALRSEVGEEQNPELTESPAGSQSG